MPSKTELPAEFWAKTPLTMDPHKGPDDQYRAGAADMLTVMQAESCRVEGALFPSWADDLRELERLREAAQAVIDAQVRFEGGKTVTEAGVYPALEVLRAALAPADHNEGKNHG